MKIEGVLSPDGSILARKIKASGRRATTSGTEVEVEGIIEELTSAGDWGVEAVVVDGINYLIIPLTEVKGTLAVGVRVKIEAIILEGFFLAKEIKAFRESNDDGDDGDDADDDDDSHSSRLEIEGVISNVHQDPDTGVITSISVNGTQVTIETGITDVEGTLEVGAIVKIEAVVRDGTVVAVEIKAKDDDDEDDDRDHKEEFETEGTIEAIERDEDGHVVSITVDGTTIAIEPVTRIRGTLVVGSRVEVKGIIVDDEPIADRIKVEGDAEDDEDDEDTEDVEDAEDAEDDEDDTHGDDDEADDDDGDADEDAEDVEDDEADDEDGEDDAHGDDEDDDDDSKDD